MTIKFVEDPGGFTGVGAGGREWRVTRTYTGWRLEFRDLGDATRTNAGVHVSLEAAQAEAAR